MASQRHSKSEALRVLSSNKTCGALLMPVGGLPLFEQVWRKSGWGWGAWRGGERKCGKRGEERGEEAE